MQTSNFRQWLKTGYLQLSGIPLAEGTQVSRAANCSTIEKFEGDLDDHFDRDGMARLLERLSAATADEGVDVHPKHQIPINGDVSNGTSTYRSAANLYRKFRVAQESGLWTPSKRIIGDGPHVTERRTFSKTRLGQDRFRYIVLERWDYRCAITKSAILLTASHIKPWRVCSSAERLDAFNGICLSPVFDKAFDVGIITFRFDGNLILSPTVPRTEAQKLGLDITARLRGLGRLHRPYLDFHHKNVWRHDGMSVNDA